ncbi:MAG: hypothetical protein ACTSV3_01770 [Candidatus Thorarchaeota archaeon]|nr:MAG: hypothetical protein DRO87_11155 [Candidatus Thorarchaeota archaeon]RLI56892.1 MAG: hypothetical protein DRP09_05020 [Candidatus Thorarchaeota archaeon]
MDIEGVVIFEAKSGIPLYSRMKGKTDPSLFSSFVAAIGHFSKELRFGGLSSFTTEEKVIYLAPREKTITALIAPKKKEYQEAYSLASELGRRFEENIELPRVPQPKQFDSFAQVADEFLKRIQNPFVSEVSAFVTAQYKGEVSVKARLFKKDGSQGTIDLLVDASASNGNSRATTDQFGSNYIFVKVCEGSFGRLQMIDFIDSLDGFGVRVMDKDGLAFRPYFPSRAVVVARDYHQGAIQFLERLPTHRDRRYVDGAHIYAGLKLKDIPKESRCFVDLWLWKDDEKPELLEVT